MSGRAAEINLAAMHRFLIHHHHEPAECGAVFASFRGHESPLRHQTALASCQYGGHAIWWVVHASTSEEALDLLPTFAAQRATAIRVGDVAIP
jgi:hypothetical protein